MSADRPQPVFLLDLDQCIGCWACAVACKMKNGLADDEWWVRVETVGGAVVDTSTGVFPNVSKYYRPVIDRCTYTGEHLRQGHEPACARACPTPVFRIGDLRRDDDPVTVLVATGETIAAPVPLGAAPAVHYLPARKARTQRRSGAG